MGFSTPRTYVAGEIHTAAHHNQYERDNIAWIATDSPACRAYNSTSVSIPNSVETPIPLNSERFDNAGVHSTVSSTTRFVVPIGAGGKYICTGSITWQVSGSGTYRACSLRVNGSTRIGQINIPPGSGINGSDATVVAVYALVAGDYVELAATQDSGGALNVAVANNYSPEASVIWFRT